MRIQTGFLAGNLGELEEYAQQYAGALTAALQREFPDAIVEVRYQEGAEGVLPSGLRTLVTDSDGVLRAERALECAQAEAIVDEIAGQVWESFAWVPDNTGD